MVAISEIGTALASLKAASELAKALLGLRDAAVIQTKVIELQGEILSAQASAFGAQEAQSALLKRVDELEKEVAGLKAWTAETERYQLTEVAPGSFAYALKPDSGGAEPPHSLCSNCFHQGHKSILQADRRANATSVLRCLRCNTEIVTKRATPTGMVIG